MVGVCVCVGVDVGSGVPDGVCVFVGVIDGVGVGVDVLVGVTVGVGVTNVSKNAASHLFNGVITCIFNVAVHPPNRSSYCSINGVQTIGLSK